MCFQVSTVRRLCRLLDVFCALDGSGRGFLKEFDLTTGLPSVSLHSACCCRCRRRCCSSPLLLLFLRPLLLMFLRPFATPFCNVFPR